MALDVRENRSGRPMTAIGVAILIVAGVGAGVWVLRNQRGTSDQAGAAGVVTPPPGAPGNSATPASPPADAGRAAGRSRGSQGPSRQAGEVPASPVTRVEADKTPDARIGAPDAAAATPPRTPGRPVPVMIVKPVYDEKDADVTAPKLLTPLAYAPLAAGHVEATSGAVQILVNDDGTVDSVKATVAPKTIGETILMTSGLSIAKAWRFDPALKDGHPVRYSLIVPLSRMFRDSREADDR